MGAKDLVRDASLRLIKGRGNSRERRMGLKDLIIAKKTAILKRWFDMILGTYPEETSNHLRKQADPFANPISHTISKGIEGIFSTVIEGTDIESAFPFLDNIIKLRAVQDSTPSGAIAFILLLKKAIREELKDKIHEGVIYHELLALESNIDEITLLCFDLYMKCREKVYELKANEVKNMTFRLLQRANHNL